MKKVRFFARFRGRSGQYYQMDGEPWLLNMPCTARVELCLGSFSLRQLEVEIGWALVLGWFWLLLLVFVFRSYAQEGNVTCNELPVKSETGESHWHNAVFVSVGMRLITMDLDMERFFSYFAELGQFHLFPINMQEDTEYTPFFQPTAASNLAKKAGLLDGDTAGS